MHVIPPIAFNSETGARSCSTDTAWLPMLLRHVAATTADEPGHLLWFSSVITMRLAGALAVLFLSFASMWLRLPVSLYLTANRNIITENSRSVNVGYFLPFYFLRPFHPFFPAPILCREMPRNGTRLRRFCVFPRKLDSYITLVVCETFSWTQNIECIYHGELLVDFVENWSDM